MSIISSIDEMRSAAFAAISRVNSDHFNNEFDPLDIAAFCQVESGFDPAAYRYEPRISDASYGIMQILLKVARKQYGFDGNATQLFNIETGLLYGMMHVKWTCDYLHSHGCIFPEHPHPMMIVAAAYNAGVGNVMHGFHDDVYMNKWLAARESLCV